MNKYEIVDENPHIKEMYLPVNKCLYCKTQNWAFGIQCKKCGARVDFKENLESNVKQSKKNDQITDKQEKTIGLEEFQKGVDFLKVDISTEEGKELIELYSNNKLWICDCGVANLNLPISGGREVKCAGCGRKYEKGENILPLEVLYSFGFDDGNDYNDNFELGKGKELLLLWQEAFLKIQLIDKSNGNRAEFEKVKSKIEEIKDKSEIIYGKRGQELRDGKKLILFLKGYLVKGGLLKKITEKTKLKIIGTMNYTDEHPYKSFGIFSSGFVAFIMLYYFVPYNKAKIDNISIYNKAILEIQKKGWIEKEYISKKCIPQLNTDTNELIYVCEEIKDDSFNIFQKYKEQELPIQIGEIVEKKGKIIEIGTGTYDTGTDGKCVAAKAAVELLKIIIENSNSGNGGSNGGGNHKGGSHKGGGVGFGHGGGMSLNKKDIDILLKTVRNEPGYTGFTYTAGPNNIGYSGYKKVKPKNSKYIKHSYNYNKTCAIKYEMVIRVPIKYKVQKYKVYDYDQKLTRYIDNVSDGFKLSYPNYVPKKDEKVSKLSGKYNANIKYIKNGDYSESKAIIPVNEFNAKGLSKIKGCTYTYSKFSGPLDTDNILNKCGK